MVLSSKCGLLLLWKEATWCFILPWVPGATPSLQLPASCLFSCTYWFIRNLYLQNSHPVRRQKEEPRANRSSYDCHGCQGICSLQNTVSLSMESHSSRPRRSISAILETRRSISSTVSEKFWIVSIDVHRSRETPLCLFAFLPLLENSERH